MVRKLVASVALLAMVTLSDAGNRERFPLPGLRVPDGWGVNIHFTQPAPGEVEKIAAAGFRWVRMDLTWQAVEKSKGVYDFSGYDVLMRHLRAHRMRALLILDYGNDLYEKGAPRTPESRAAFCRFVERAVERYRGRGVVWEMWNEPNIFFWQPRPNVEQYIRLARQVGETIRRVAPDEWYVGPATSGFDWAFLERCFESGMLDYWDAVSVHPYRGNEPESAAPDWARLKELVARHAPAGREVPLLSGEWGYSELYQGLNIDLQAQYIVRQYLANLMNGVGLSIWYDWKNDGNDPKETEHFFGTVDHRLVEKPAYRAAKAAASALNGLRFVARRNLGSDRDYCLEFAGAGKTVCAYWTTGEEHPATFRGRTWTLTGTPRFETLR